MTRLSPDNVSLVFASLAHAFMHMFAAYYFTIVLALEIAWDRPFAELIGLWTPAAILIGLAAVPAGWLADRWSARAMIALAFAGMGAFSIIAGFTKGPATMLPILAAVGIFAAVYHPVGIPWVMRVAYRNPGKALAINGLFGGVGVGFAGLTAGTLIDVAGWPAAFIVPGLVSLAVAAAMALLIRAGRVAEPDRQPDSKTGQPTRDERLRGVTILLATTFAGGLTYQVTQSAAPKLFDARLGDLLGDGTFGIGLVVFAVYFPSGFGQLAGGWLADRWSWKGAYLVAWCINLPMLWLAASLVGPVLVIVVIIMTTAATSALPAESLLFARFVPARHHALFFGLRYVLALGAAPIAIQFVAFVQSATGDFAWLYWTLGATALGVIAAIAFLPPARAGLASDEERIVAAAAE
jgi:MFS family permease